MFSGIPPLFWPIFLAVVLLCTMRRAFVLPFLTWYRAPPELSPLRKETDSMLEDVRHAYIPKTLNPERPGNLAFMTASTREKLHLLHAKLVRQAPWPWDSGIPDPEDDLEEWYEYLKKVRSHVK